jgi:hypothetical protein
MDFKKMSQLIWMVLAFLFIVVLFLHVYSKSIYIDQYEGSNPDCYIKFNKLTNQIRVYIPGKNYKWVLIERGEKEGK